MAFVLANFYSVHNFIFVCNLIIHSFLKKKTQTHTRVEGHLIFQFIVEHKTTIKWFDKNKFPCRFDSFPVEHIINFRKFVVRLKNSLTYSKKRKLIGFEIFFLSIFCDLVVDHFLNEIS